MQPEHRRIKNRSAVAGRARMLVKADLSWVSGFPIGQGPDRVYWMTVPVSGRAPARLEVDGQVLYRATRAWKKLNGRYRRVVRDVIDDYDGFSAGFPALIERLKLAVHHQQDIEPPSLLGQVLDWVESTRPGKREAAVAWASRWSKRLPASRTPEDRARLAQIWRFQVEDRAGHWESMLSWWSGSARLPSTMPPQMSLLQWAQSLEQGKANLRPKLAFDWSCADVVSRMVAVLVVAKRQDRRRMLALWDLMAPSALVSDWTSWFDSVDAFFPIIRREHVVPTDQAPGIAKRARELHLGMPPTLPLPSIVRAITRLRDTDLEIPALWAAAQQVPERWQGVAIRSRLVQHWLALRQFHGRARVQQLIAVSGDFWRRTPEPKASAVYADFFRGQAHWSVEHELIFSEVDVDRWSGALDVAAVHPEVPRRSVVLALHCPVDQADVAVRSYLAQPKISEWVEDTHVRFALEVSEGTEAFGRVLKWASDSGLSEAELTGFSEADRQARAANLGPVVASCLSSDTHEDLATIARASRILMALGDAAVTLPAPVRGPVDWISDYPEELRDNLYFLADAAEDAVDVAARTCRQDAPTRAALRSEIEALDARILSDENLGLIKRKVKLERRLANPVTLSAHRIAKLNDKLTRARRRALVHRWRDEVVGRTVAALGRTLGDADWHHRTEYYEVIASVLDLPNPSRRLGLALMRARGESAPWDLRNHADNARFIRRLTEAGLKLRPWLDGVAALAKGDGPRRVVLALEPDPVEVLKMGAPFKTCLAPGQFNFFSAVSNAVDVNKRVLYARRDDGAVVGRCLLALTREGGLLTFEPYCNDKKLPFEEMVAEFVTDLALRMDTIVVDKGPVPCLVSSDWYDDGPRGLVPAFPALEAGSPLRRSLERLPPGAVLEALSEALQPVGLNDLSLPMVVQWPELSARPELMVRLAPSLNASSNLDETTLVTAINALRAAGRRDLARTLAVHRLVPRVKEDQSRWDLAGRPVIELLVDLDPAVALRTIWALKPNEEWSQGYATWSEYYGLALLAMHRPVQARRCFETARSGLPKGDHARLTALLESL